MKSPIVYFLSAVGALVIAVVFSGCIKPEEFPLEPNITYDKFSSSGDSGKISFKFTDGDGDIGLGDDEINPPYDTSSKFYNNVFIRYYEKVNGVWKQGIGAEGEPVEFTYRTKKIQPMGKNKALKGTIIVNIVPFYYNPFSTDSDTIKFDIQMADRSLNLSNIVESPEIVR